ncbi:PKD domain-containing protein [Candidatus Bipolaricaulota bacterium]
MKRLILVILLLAITSGATWAGVRLDLDAGVTADLANALDAAATGLEGQTGDEASAVFLGGTTAVQTPPLTAFLVSSHDTAVTLETVTFSASESLPGNGVIVLYEWDLDGDGEFGAASSSETWEHAYADDGTQLVQVRITNDQGEFALSEVLQLDIVNRLPIARFEADVGDAAEGSLIQFRDLSHDEDGEISSWSWDFGDGTTASSISPTHTYNSAGPFSVTLTVIDDDGVASDVYVFGIEIQNLEPSATFTLRQSTVNAGQPLTLVDESFDPSLEGEIVHVAWDFGDGVYQAGGPSSDNVYSHVFSVSGTYAITLYVIDNDGAMARAQTTVNVL